MRPSRDQHTLGLRQRRPSGCLPSRWHSDHVCQTVLSRSFSSCHPRDVRLRGDADVPQGAQGLTRRVAQLWAGTINFEMVQTPEGTQAIAIRSLVMNCPAWTLLLLLSLSPAPAAQPKTWRGTWSATVGNGSTVFGGTWDAAVVDDADTLSGRWTLMDKSGATLADGTWAAHKDQNVWRGIWKARNRSGRLYSGTWRAQSQLPVSNGFSELLESALTKVANGTWQVGTYSGTWLMRAYPHQ
jgi:hypothetical protein